MIAALIIISICNIAIIYSMYSYLRKRIALGDVLMKVKMRKIYFLLMILFSLFGIALLVFITVRRLNYFSSSEWYPTMDSILFAASELVYIILILKGLIQAFAYRELRETGIVLSGIILEYSDIRGINWVKDNKIEINYKMRILNRVFKECWVIKDEQITELKQLLKDKYFDAYSIEENE